MNSFKRLSAQGLFILFISLSFGLLFVIGGAVLYSQTDRVVLDLQKKNSQVELRAAEHFFSQYIINRVNISEKIAKEPLIISSILGTQTSRLEISDHISLLNFPITPTTIEVIDIAGDSLFFDTQLAPDEVLPIENIVLEKYIENGFTENFIHLLPSKKGVILRIHSPVVYQNHTEGVIYSDFIFNPQTLFSSIVEDKNRWFGLSDLDSGWTMSPPKPGEWIEEKLSILNTDIVLDYAISTTEIDDQKFRLFESLAIALCIGMAIAILIIYLLGKTMLVHPFQRLAESQKKLKQQKIALQRKELETRELASVVEKARDTIVITDKDGDITWVNKAFTTLTGYSLDEVKNQNPGRVLQGKDSDQNTIQQIRTSLRNDQSIRCQLLNYDKKGVAYWVDMDISPILDDKGEVLKFVSIERDITEQKRMQHEIVRQAEEAKIANQAKSNFLATMSHEIRTPLNGILGITQLLQEQSHDQKQLKMLNIITDSGKDLLTLLNDILDYSKTESKMMELDIQPFEISSLINSISETYTPLCTAKNLEFVIKNDMPAESILYGDEGRIRQVIYNLLSNALKFTAQGSISFILSIDPERPNGVLLQIIDTGVGISSDKLDVIFAPFTQADTSTTRKYGGTGLGLSIVQKLVILMEGKIELTSKLDLGSHFSIYLPVNVSTNQKPAMDMHLLNKTNDTVNSGLDVLIVEDNHINALVARKFCERLGHNAEVCVNGIEALLNLKRHSYDLILMDNHMPELNGIDTTAQIRQSLGLDVTIIACTADTDPLTHQQFLKNGACHILTKPLLMDDLSNAINEHKDKIIKPSKNRTLDNATTNQLNILVIDDDETNAFVMQQFCQQLGHTVAMEFSAQYVIAQHDIDSYDVIITDNHMPSISGVDLTNLIRMQLKSSVIILACTADLSDTASQALLSAGVEKIISKPVNKNTLEKVLQQHLPHILKHRKQRQQKLRIKK